MIKVVAFDPGVTSGYATGRIEDGLMKVSTGQAQWNHSDFWHQLSLFDPNVIVYERFEFRAKARAGLELISREYIGVMELYAQLNKISIYKQQPGSVINGYFDAAKLKADKLWKPGKIHSNEACMHLLYWYTYGSGYQYNTQGYVSGN